MLLVLAIFGTLLALVTPRLHDALEQAKVARAIGDIDAIQTELNALEYDAGLPETLAPIGRANYEDPWGNPYQYYRFETNSGGKGGGGLGKARKDRFLVPINSSYDLYSMGSDGESQAPLTAKASHDDIIRANDGAYIGLASKY